MGSLSPSCTALVLLASPVLSLQSLPSPVTPHDRFITKPLSVMGFVRTGIGFAPGLEARQSAWPNRVCFHYGRLCLPSRCSPPRLAATQLRLATGRSRFTRTRTPLIPLAANPMTPGSSLAPASIFEHLLLGCPHGVQQRPSDPIDGSSAGWAGRSVPAAASSLLRRGGLAGGGQDTQVRAFAHPASTPHW